MKTLRGSHRKSHGFSLIEVIITMVVGALVGVVVFSYMGTALIHSGDPISIARSEGVAENWMERILSDYVQEMNKQASYTTTLATIHGRDYTLAPYNMPTSVSLTRTYVIYDADGNEQTVSPGTSTNLKVTIMAGGHGMTTILTNQRATNGDPTAYY